MKANGTSKEESSLTKSIIKATIAVLGLISAVVTIYSAIIVNKKVDLTIDVISNTNVLDIKTEVSRLSILYDGNNLRETKKNLRLILLRIENKGNEAILSSSYDEKDPVGFYVKNGKILETPELIFASNSYLLRNQRVLVDSSKRVLLSNLIMEPGEYYTFRLLVLHDTWEKIKIGVLGKIAGQKEIHVIDNEATKNKTIIENVIEGELVVHLLRLLAYTLIIAIIALSLVGIAKLTEVTTNFIKQRKRRLIQKKYESIRSIRMGMTEVEQKVFEKYVKGELWVVNTILKNIEFYKDHDNLEEYYQTKKEAEIQKKEHEKKLEAYKRELEKTDKVITDNFYLREFEIEKLVELGVIKVTRSGLDIDQQLLYRLTVLRDFLKNNDKNVRLDLTDNVLSK